jgi:hypothetical protein
MIHSERLTVTLTNTLDSNNTVDPTFSVSGFVELEGEPTANADVERLRFIRVLSRAVELPEVSLLLASLARALSL